MTRKTTSLALATLAVFSATPVLAQELTGTLAKIAELGEITVGHRDGQVPFSYYDDAQNPIGYAMDICAAVVEAIKDELDLPDLAVSYLPVTGTTRIPLLANETIDMECGTTTNTVERQEQVDFSTTYFVAAVRILSKTDNPFETMADLAGQTIVTLAGTTSVSIINDANNTENLNLNVLSVQDLAEGMLTIETDRATAFVFDDVTLAGGVATSRDPSIYQISDTALSVEPYAVMLRRGDPEFKALVDATIEGLFADGSINEIYDRWFIDPIPPRGVTVNLPMSQQLESVIASPTDSADPEDYL